MIAPIDSIIQKTEVSKQSLSTFSQHCILDSSLIQFKDHCLALFPDYFAARPIDYILSFEDMAKHQNQKHIRIIEHFQKYYKNNQALFKVFGSSETTGAYSLTNLLCYPAIEYLGSPQQFQQFSKLAEDGRLVAAYAQTEIEHGSDVQSLSLEAVFNSEKKCLVFNTPSAGAIKFWPGALGIFGTHIVTQAKLSVKGESHGLQTFVVQIRDMKTLKDFDGVVAGDLGPKLGFRSIDNGYLQFENFEAPLDSLLSRYIQIDQEGNVTKNEDKGANKIAYGAMMTLRGNLTRFFTQMLSKNIQMGHLHRRLEGKKPFEVRRDLEVLAQYYSLVLSAKHVKDTLRQFLECYHVDQKKAIGMIREIHLLTTGFKVLSSWKLVEASRKEGTSMALGNLLLTGVVQQYSDMVPTTTYEGDNVVLLLQVIRVVMSYYTGLMTGKNMPEAVEFLNRFQTYAMDQKDFDEVIEVNSAENLIFSSELILENFAFKSIQLLSKKLEQAVFKDGIPFKRVLSEELQTELVLVALRVFEVVKYKLAVKVYKSSETSVALEGRDLALLEKLLQLHKLAYIKDKLNAILDSRVLRYNDNLLDMLKDAKEIYCVDLAPEIDYLYEQGAVQGKEISTVIDFKNFDNELYVKEADKMEKVRKEMQMNINRLSKL